MTSAFGIPRAQSDAVRFVDEVPDWDGTLPVILIGSAATGEVRRTRLKTLVARALMTSSDRVEIEHRPQRRPIVSRPENSGLYLSMATRGEVAAMALAQVPIGVDVEIVEPGAEIPWQVLHPDEIAMLKELSGRPQAAAFTRLWTLKEAYLKALRVGFEREPSSYAVTFIDEERAELSDPLSRATVAETRTTWRRTGDASTAVSVVLLESSLL